MIIMLLPSCLDCHAHSMLVSTTNQKRAATSSSSLCVEEVEEKPVSPTKMVVNWARTRASDW